MKKTKILLATLFILVFFFSIISVEKTNGQVYTPPQPNYQSVDSIYGINGASTVGAPKATIVPQGTTPSQTGSAADMAAYQAQLKQMYTGYPPGVASQSPGGAAIGGCVGSFVGSWVGGQVSKGLNSLFPSTPIEIISIPTTDAQQKSANFREETLNGMAFCIGNALIDAMSASIVQWINSGFKNPDGTSGPGFLTNPGEFFKQIADQAVGGFFQGLGPIGNIICKPFDLQIRLSLLNEYNRGNGYGAQQCSLTSIQQNFANFGKGGNYMRDWFQLTQQSNNNAMGSYFNARQKLAEGITYDVAQNKMEIDLGKGFFNLKKCVKYSATKKDLNTGKAQCEKWETTTPGAEVQASLDRAIGSKTHRIEIATNFNQIISALVNQIVIQAMSGLSGGMNSGSSGGSSGKNNYPNYSDTGAPVIPPITPIATSTASGTAPTITSLSPTSGGVGTQITVTGTGFTPTGNRVKFGNLGTENNPVYSFIPSTNGTTLSFTVPFGNYLACFSDLYPCAGAQPAYPGAYNIYIINVNGISSSNIVFTIN